MLDKLSNQILDFMLSSTNNPSTTRYNFDSDLKLIAENTKSDKDAIRLAVAYLKENGFIKYLYAGDKAVFFFLDHKGLHKNEMQKMELLLFIKKSILTPIIVAFITSLATPSLWSALLHWLQKMLLRLQ